MLIAANPYLAVKVYTENLCRFINRKKLYFTYFKILGFYPLLEMFVINSLFK
ncbi:hypothetical protein HMPREF1552_01414 [Leptotrichia sp. oral taxon 879 str. F0557]|nr:hypothetical protein HMPREF1552_01414 [Leptotrichia sp. oral taxon 879 str. F0557]